LRTKFLQLDFAIEAADVERFFDYQVVWHEELENLAETTRVKLRTVILRMLRETEMVTKQGLLIPPSVSDDFIKAAGQVSQEHLLFFPIASTS
jgi:hypothetical protein